MVKHVLVAVASAVALLSGGAAEAAYQQCPVLACAIGTDVCDETSSVNCHFCVLPEHSPVVPCLFGT